MKTTVIERLPFTITITVAALSSSFKLYLVIIELNKHSGAIRLERKQFESERERMLALVNQMDAANREQREMR